MAWRSWSGSVWCCGRLEPDAQHAFCNVGRGSSHGLSACRQGRGTLVPLIHFLKPRPGSCPGVAAGHHVPGRWTLVRRARAPGHSCCRLTPHHGCSRGIEVAQNPGAWGARTGHQASPCFQAWDSAFLPWSWAASSNSTGVHG